MVPKLDLSYVIIHVILDGDDIKLNEDTEKVLLAEIKDNEKCKKIIDNWTARIHRNEEEQRMPGKCWWKCLKKELPRNKRNVVVMAIKDRTLLTPRVFINDTEFRQCKKIFQIFSFYFKC